MLSFAKFGRAVRNIASERIVFQRLAVLRDAQNGIGEAVTVLRHAVDYY